MVISLLLTGCSPIDPHAEPPIRHPYTGEERAKVDLSFFNELSVRKSAYHPDGYKWRYAWFKSRADEGYELAELALRLFDFPDGVRNPDFDREAWNRLKVLANQGDAASQCLLVYAGGAWKKLSRKRRDHYRMLSAEQKFPGCARHFAAMASREKRWKDLIRFEINAAKLGNHTSQLLLISAYAQGHRGFPLNIGKARCWYQIAQRPEFDTGRSSTYRARLSMWERDAKSKGLSTWARYSPQSWCEQPAHSSQKMDISKARSNK